MGGSSVEDSGMDSVVFFPSVSRFCVLSISGEDLGEDSFAEHSGADSVVRILEWILWWMFSSV